MLKEYSKLFTDPQIHYPIDNNQLSFADYISQCQALITQTRIDLTENPQRIITANSPYELRPTMPDAKFKLGALLIHGLFDSPLVMKDIGLHLQNQGILTRAILLPGHGTVPGALLNVHYQQWLQTLHYGITQLANEVDQIILVGFSTGAALALYHALQEKNQKIAALICLAPALKIHSFWDFASDWYRYIDRIWPRAQWLQISAEETIDYAKYQSIPFNAVNQVYQLGKKIRSIDPSAKLSCPVFFCLSMDDTTINSSVSIDYFQLFSHAKSRLLLYSNTKKTYPDARIIIRPSAHPDMNIVNLSHIGMPIAPTNPHYGLTGDYCNASHLEKDRQPIYGEFNPYKYKLNALAHQYGFSQTLYQRLSFNPDFEFLMQLISQFIQEIN